MAGKKTSKGQEGYYATYKASGKYAKNRKAKLERALKAQPNNEQIKIALKNIVYRRKTPNTQVWSASEIRVAKLFKEFTGTVNRAIFNPNDKVSGPALRALGKKDLGPRLEFKTIPGLKKENIFALGAVAHDGRGNLVWG